MKLTRVYLLLVTMIIFGASNAIANEDQGHWGNSTGQKWKTGFGDCWNASVATVGAECGGEAPAPAAAPADTIYWYDEDGDGVLDADDACPRTPIGVPVDSNGCANDNDGDGVPDYLDQCPETPLGTVVDTNGCGLALVKLKGIHFDFDSAALTSKAKSILDRAMPTLRQNQSKNVVVEGHTDTIGSDTYNLDLSQRRAQSVINYLVSNGANSARLTAKGLGETSPVSSNDTQEGRALNRRVEIYAR
jgi:OmpA-OmpF porin, OOP family